MAPAQRQLIWIWLAKVQIIAVHSLLSLSRHTVDAVSPMGWTGASENRKHAQTYISRANNKSWTRFSSTLEMKINGAHLEIGKHGGFLCFWLGKNKYTHAHNMHIRGQHVEVWSVEKKRSELVPGQLQERYLGDVRACVRHKTPLRAGKSLLSYAYRRCAGNLENILRRGWPAPARHKWISTSHVWHAKWLEWQCMGPIDRLSRPARALI